MWYTLYCVFLTSVSVNVRIVENECVETYIECIKIQLSWSEKQENRVKL